MSNIQKKSSLMKLNGDLMKKPASLQTNQLKTIQKTSKIPVAMPPDLYGKLWMLHQLNKEVEFSGLLFYSAIGELRNPESFSIELKDFYLMDIGTKAYTEFEFQNKMFNLYDEKPELLQYQYGLLHSHRCCAFIE